MSDIKYRVLPDCDLMQIYDGFDVGAMGLRLAPDTAHLFASAPEMKERIAELEAIVERVEIECDLWPDCSPLAPRVRALLATAPEGGEPITEGKAERQAFLERVAGQRYGSGEGE